MRKALIGIILLIGLIAFLGGCTMLPCTKDEDCVNFECPRVGEIEKTCDASEGKCHCIYEEAPVDFCREKEAQINEKISELNYCEKDEDCVYADLKDPWCLIPVNKESDLSEAKGLIENYLTECVHAACDPAPFTYELECSEGKCVQIIEEWFCWGEEIPDEKEYADAKCCDGFTKILKTSPCEPGSDYCMENGCPIPEPRIIYGGICAPCGNGLCEEEYGENKCSCKEDCGVAIQAVPPARPGPDDYLLSEDIEIQIKNNSKESTWYPERIDGCKKSFFSLEKIQTSGWEEVSYGFRDKVCEAPSISLKELAAGETASFVFEKGTTYGEFCEAVDCQLSPGKYKAKTVYYNEEIEGIHEELPEGGIEISSPQFEIILPHAGISIKTDKEEYEEGETVKITISLEREGLWAEMNYYCGHDPKPDLFIYKRQGTGWLELKPWKHSEWTYNCPESVPVAYPTPCHQWIELEETEFEWNQEYCHVTNAFSDQGSIEKMQAEPGAYWVKTCYYNWEGSEDEQCRNTDEFTIKEAAG